MGWKSRWISWANCYFKSRNPLSLDMGWKIKILPFLDYPGVSQSAFAGYGLEVDESIPLGGFIWGRNPLSLDMGWKTANLQL